MNKQTKVTKCKCGVDHSELIKALLEIDEITEAYEVGSTIEASN